MKTSICKHCLEEIGEWETVEFQDGRHEYTGHWMHAPDDGPDAYAECHCKCDACKPDTTLGIHDPCPADCCDGEEAEPIDPWIYLGDVKTSLANHHLFTWGDELAWIICDEKQKVVDHD